jgi:hypothetical protein
MSDDGKIISLTDRARLRKGGRQPGSKAGPSSTSPMRRDEQGDVDGNVRPGADEATPLSKPALISKPVPTQLVWLYCPTCQTLEYTELALPNGRVHQPCGTQVEEVAVDVDARAEYSLAELNLRQLERLAELVDGQRARFREYQHRLELAAHQPLSSYPLTEDTVRKMPVAEVDPLGLLISAFLKQPLQRFRPEAAEPTSETAPAGKPSPAIRSGSDSGSESGDEPAR